MSKITVALFALTYNLELINMNALASEIYPVISEKSKSLLPIPSVLFDDEYENIPSLSIEAEKISQVLSLTPSDIADTYLLSFSPLSAIDFKPNILDFIRRNSQNESAEAKAILAYDIYQHVDNIAAKHILSFAAFLLDYTNADRVQMSKILNLSLEKRAAREILENLYMESLIRTIRYSHSISQDPIYNYIFSGFNDVYNAWVKANNNWDFSLLLLCITETHNIGHHSGGSLLEKMMHPKYKNELYNLLLRFASMNSEFVLFSAHKYASNDAKKFYNASWRLLYPYEMTLRPRYFPPKEEALLLAEELTGEMNATKRNMGDYLNRCISSMKGYPLFSDISSLKQIASKKGSYHAFDDLSQQILNKSVEQKDLNIPTIVSSIISGKNGNKFLRLFNDYPELYHFLA